MKNNKLIAFARWILFIPGAFMCCYVVSWFIRAFPEVIERMDLGFTTLSVFLANLFNSCIWGASFSISGLWIAPKKNVAVNNVLAIVVAVWGIFVGFTTIYFDNIGIWGIISMIIFLFAQLFGSIIGGLMYLDEINKN